MAWGTVLADQQCNSSSWICIDHFKPDDYWVYGDGKRIVLKTDAIPSIFNVCLIEVNEEVDIQNQISEQSVFICDENESKISEAKELQLQNTKLCQEIEQLKKKIDSQKFITNSRIRHLKDENLYQSKKIRDLENQLQQYDATLNASIRGLNVGTLNFFSFQNDSIH